ncbi:MAG TPA: TonB-dependent receptor [Caulobacteraceae bacterium]|jgi:iron complex outermembrane receptor protein|nr:TonB-dependent receptor [Caulobacteraceae bacterium]
MTTSRLLLAGASLSALAVMAIAAPASAQTAPAPRNSTVSEVIVTAQKRSEDIQKAAVAITAVPAAALDKSFITEVAGLNGIVPSMETTKTSGFENIVTIRGVGSETPENGLTTVPGVALFTDGVYLSNTITLDQTLFDINRIEVLRGPQGALYGQSATGGAILIVTNQPELGQLSGKADLSLGTYLLSRERGELNLPLGDTVALRLSAQELDHEGFTRDLAIPGFREDDTHATSLKAAALWKPNDRFSATLSAEWYRNYTNGAAQKNINDTTPGAWAIFQDYPGKFDLTAELYHLNMQYDFDWFSVRSVTAWQGLNNAIQEDSSRSAISVLGAYDDVAAWNTWVHSYTEEFDILSKPGSRLEWIAGAFLLSQTSNQFVVEYGGTNPNPVLAVPDDVQANPPNNLTYGNNSDVTRHSYAGFAQATYHVLDNLRITAGGRINYDDYRDDSHNFHEAAEGPPNTVDNSQSDQVWTWHAEVDYDWANNEMVYVSANRGYKPGGVNGSYGQVLIPPIFVPETNTAFEIGSKSLVPEWNLRFNVAAFYDLYKNMQYIETDPVPFDGGIANIPNVHMYGVEAEASWASPDGRLHINGNIALERGRVQGPFLTIDSTVANAIEGTNPFCTEFFGGGKFFDPRCWSAVIAASKDIGGNTPPAMPTVSGSADISYSFDIPWGTLTPRAQVIYRGSEWARIFNEPSLDRVPAYTQTNLSMDYAPHNSRLLFTLTATNVFDVAGVNSQYTDPYGTGQTSRQYIAPLQVIFTAGYSF